MSVRANELRVGNWVSYDGFTLAEPVHKMIEVQVKSITGTGELDGINWEWDHDNGGYGFTGFQQLEGIPLSEDWLLKFGFERSNNHYWKDRFAISMLWNENDNPMLWFYFQHSFSRESIDVKVTSVHQLQNLYWSLTSSELTT